MPAYYPFFQPEATEATLTFSAEDFAKALEQHDYQFQKGSVVSGKVFSHGSDGVYVDIGGKAAAFLPLNEVALKQFDPADLPEILPLDSERQFLITRDQDEEGQVVLSIRQLELKTLWEELKDQQDNNETLTVKVTGNNKGGVVVDVHGLRGFVPRSHLSPVPEDLASLIGSTLTVAFLDVRPDDKKLVLSQRIAARTTTMSRLEQGQLIEGTVVNIKPFGIFVEFDGVTGLLHIKQISKNYVDSLPNLIHIGDSIKAVIVSLDDVQRRISLSTKVLEKHPGEILHDFAKVMAEAEERSAAVGDLLAESDL
ncbi:MAG: S1 RNA-binding domain-containing protein [Cyanobacteria bacterium J06659_2]